MTTGPSFPAWQPLTLGGVASFATAGMARLWFVQFVVSALVAGSVIWTLRTGWFPVIAKAIDALPDQAAIQNRRLIWPDRQGASLGENAFLSIRVSLDQPAPGDPGADVQVVLGGLELRIISLLGFVDVPYPAGWNVSLNRADARAWWEARRGLLLLGAGLLSILALFLSWTMLAFLYCAPVRLIAFQLDRSTSIWACWRLAGAAVLPGAVVMAGAILLYSTRRLDLVGVLFAWLLHIAIGWVYVIAAPTRLARMRESTRRRNPFRADRPQT